jgi:hypothetical protein
MEVHTYRKYKIRMEPHGRDGRGWQAMICAPNSTQWTIGPQSDSPTSHKDVLSQAKSFVDGLCASGD